MNMGQLWQQRGHSLWGGIYCDHFGEGYISSPVIQLQQRFTSQSYEPVELKVVILKVGTPKCFYLG